MIYKKILKRNSIESSPQKENGCLLMDTRFLYRMKQ